MWALLSISLSSMWALQSINRALMFNRISHHSNSLIDTAQSHRTLFLDGTWDTMHRNPTNKTWISGRVWKVPCFCRSRRCARLCRAFGLVSAQLLLVHYWLCAIWHLDSRWLNKKPSVKRERKAYWLKTQKLQFKIIAQTSKLKDIESSINW